MNHFGELAKYDILHFAVHSISSRDDYRDNELILSEPGGSNEDGFLQFDEIAKLKLNAKLVGYLPAKRLRVCLPIMLRLIISRLHFSWQGPNL